MDPLRNPYVPGAGRRPSALVGRDVELAAWAVALQRVEGGRDDRSMALYGLRGVGKTVLLREFARRAGERQWVVGAAEAGTDRTLREILAEALHPSLVDLSAPSPGARVLRALKTFLSFKASYDTSGPAGGSWSFGLDLKDSGGGGADTGVLDLDLAQLVRDLSAAAGERGTGLALLIDEAQDLSRAELTAICSLTHAAGQQGWPLLVTLAGLPSLPRELSEAKSYAERLFSYHRIEHLAGQVARDALTAPALLEGVSWDREAVEHVVADTHGYPYFLQEYGQATWAVAAGEAITATDARVGAAHGMASLDAGFFRSRWDRATNSERQYLRAMATDGDAGSSSSTVAARVNKKPQSLGPTRAGLIQKGLIYAPEHGVVAFTVPGMASFIQRQHHE